MTQTLRFAALSLTVVLATGLPSARAQTTTTSKPAQTQENIPADVIYRLFLRHTAVVTARAQSLDKQGKGGNRLRAGLMRKFSLDPDQLASLSQVAADLKGRLADNEAQVRDIIATWRSLYFTANGELLSGLSAPPPPPELKELGRQRRELTLQAMEKLREALGDNDYFTLDQHVRSRFASGIVRVSPGSLARH